MAITAACRQLELMRQTVAEETGGSQRHAPGLVVVIQSAVDGRIMQTIPPLPPAPMIDVTPEQELAHD
jgi:hypothetical protein